MEMLNDDPIKNIPYLLAFEMLDDKSEIAQKVINQYIDSRKPYKEQITRIVEV